MIQKTAIAVERKGLYYPWVHFKDDDWLKKTLLVFPGLYRMVAPVQVPDDSNLVHRLRDMNLIRHADLTSANVQGAQGDLMALINEDLAANERDFMAKFGREAARVDGRPSFQMSLHKDTSGFLAHMLKERGLAWQDDGHLDYPDYHELHPDLGHAVMGTLAMACAEDAGLHVVGTDSPRGRDVSGELNNTLAAGDRGGPYKYFVRRVLRPAAVEPSANELFHVLVRFNCDVSGLTPEALAKMHSEREPLRLLKERLQKLALQLPPMKDKALREEAFKDKANDVIRQWTKDGRNWSPFIRELFAVGSVGGAAQKLADAAGKLAPSATTGTLVMSGAGPVAGLAMGLLTHVAVTYSAFRERKANSPFKYLTLAEDNGVVFSLTPPAAALGT